MFAHSYDPSGLQQPPLSPHSYAKHKRQEIANCRHQRTVEAHRRCQAELERLRLMEEKLNTDEVALSEVRQWQLEEEDIEVRRRRLDIFARGGTVDQHGEDDMMSSSNLLPSPYASVSRDELEDEFSDTSYPPGEIEVVLKPSDVSLINTLNPRPAEKQGTSRQYSETFKAIRTGEQQHHQDSRQDEHKKQAKETNQSFQSDADDDDNMYAPPPHAIAAEGLSDDEEDDGDEHDLDCI